MAVSTSRSGGIYITVSGDYSQFEKDMRKIRAIANTTATDISRVMSGAMSSTLAAKNISNLSSSFQQAQRSAKAMTADMSKLDQKFKEIGLTIGVVGRDLGKFSAIQQRAFQHQNSQGLEKSLKDIQRLTGQTNEEIHLLTRTLGRTGQGFSFATTAAQSLSSALATTKGTAAAAAIAVAFATEALLNYADSYTTLQNTLKIATNGQADLSAMMEGVLAVANASATGIGETTTNFYRLHNVLKDLGATKEEVLRLTETLQKLSIHISGGSTEQAAIAMQQFTMSLTSGTVSAREYRNTISTMPMLLDALMKATGKASRAELDEAVEKGQVSSRHLFTALALVPKEIDTLYATLGTTIGQSLTVFGNNITATVGAIDDAFGASAGVGKGIESLGETIKNSSGELITFISYVDNAAVALGIYALASWKGAAALVAIQVGAKAAWGALLLNVAAFRLLTTTCGVASAALSVATVATTGLIVGIRALTVTMLTNPFFWIAAAGSGLYYLWEKTKEASAESERLRDIYREVEESIAGTSKGVQNIQEITAYNRVAKADKALAAAQDIYDKKLSEAKSYIEEFQSGLNFGTLESRMEGNIFAFSSISDAARQASILVTDFARDMQLAGKDTEAQAKVLAEYARKLSELEAAYPNAKPVQKARDIVEELGGASIATYRATGDKEGADAALKAIHNSGVGAVDTLKRLDELMAKIREPPAMATDAASAYDWLTKWTQGADAAKEAQWALEVSTARTSYSLLAQMTTLAFLNKRFEDFKTLSAQLAEQKILINEKTALGPDGGKGAEEAKQYALQIRKEIADTEHKILYIQQQQAGVSQQTLDMLNMEHRQTKAINDLEAQAAKAKMLGSDEYKQMVEKTKQLQALEMQVAKSKELADLMEKIRGQAVMPKDAASAYDWLVKFTQGADAAKEAQWELDKSIAANSIAMLEQELVAMRLQAALLKIGAIGNIDVRVRMDLITADANRLESEIKEQKDLVINRIVLGPDGGSGGGGGRGGGRDEAKEYAQQTRKKIADLDQEILYIQKEQAGVSQQQIELLKMKYDHTKSIKELEEQADKAKMLGSDEYKQMVEKTNQLHAMKLRVAEYEAAWGPVLNEMQHAVDLANALGVSSDAATIKLKQMQLFMTQLPGSPGYGSLANKRKIEIEKADIERLKKEREKSLFSDTRDYLILSPELQQQELQRFQELYKNIDLMQQESLIGEETAALARQRIRAEEQGGAIAGAQGYYDSIKSMSDSLAEATFNALKGVEDFFVNMITKLEFDFSTLVDSILADLARIVVQQSITKPLAGWLANMFPNAQGNTYAAGSGLGQHRNSVVSTPTVFAFASGGVPNFGLMGEKPGSPGEAIMPLTRVGGDLGVKAIVGQPQAPVMNVNVYEAAGTKATVSQSDDGTSLDVIVEMIANKMQSRIDRGAMQGLQKKRAYI